MRDKVTFPAVIRIFTRKETGESWLIREPSWFDEEEERQTAAFMSKLDIALANDLSFQTLSEEAKAQVRQRPIDTFHASFQELRDKHAKAWDGTKEYRLTLVKPTHREVLAAKSKAKKINDATGFVTYDNDEIMESLLVGHVLDEDENIVKIEESDIDVLVEEVKLRIWRSVRTNEERLLSSSPVPRTSAGQPHQHGPSVLRGGDFAQLEERARTTVQFLRSSGGHRRILVDPAIGSDSIKLVVGL